MANAVEVRPYSEDDRADLINLWERCDLTRPWNNPGLDIDRKMGHSPEGLLVATLDGRIIGSVMVGYDGHRGWINYLAADPDRRGTGLGRLLMDACVSHLEPLGCPKINFQIRNTNTAAMEFYDHIGYTVDDCSSMGKRLVSDD